jgi:hypothetical protein
MCAVCDTNGEKYSAIYSSTQTKTKLLKNLCVGLNTKFLAVTLSLYALGSKNTYKSTPLTKHTLKPGKITDVIKLLGRKITEFDQGSEDV